MKIFISWSKGLSKEVGEILNEWIPGVLPDVEPWISSDMDKGLVWFGDISNQLAQTKFGIFILTPENITSPWILFEAGALYKGIGKSCVCPLLVNLSPDELLKSPLHQFQCAFPEKKDMLKLIQAINSNRENKYEKNWVQKQFNNCWEEFEEKFSSVLKDCLTKRKEKAHAVIYRQLDSQDKPSKDQIIEAFELLSSDEIAEISESIESERDTRIRALASDYE